MNSVPMYIPLLNADVRLKSMMRCGKCKGCMINKTRFGSNYIGGEAKGQEYDTNGRPKYPPLIVLKPCEKYQDWVVVDTKNDNYVLVTM